LENPSCVEDRPCCAFARARMSSTGFFHSRRCGTMADAGCWAFILGAFVIHPPKPTQLQAESLFVAASCRAAVGTYDAGLPPHSLLRDALRPFTHPARWRDTQAPRAQCCAYTIVRAIRRTVNSIVCETLALVTSTVTALWRIAMLDMKIGVLAAPGLLR
jgi:hypothetical protein